MGVSMPKPKDYVVEPRNSYWILSSSKGKTFGRFLTQRQAIEAGSARTVAAGGQLVIKKLDGTVQSKRVYGRERFR